MDNFAFFVLHTGIITICGLGSWSESFHDVRLVPEESVIQACGDQGVCDCFKYAVVNCSHRQLTSVPLGIPNNTRYLYIDFNDITDIPYEFMKQFEHLVELDISHNKIEKPFRLPSNIMTFVCGNNELKTVDGFFKDSCDKLRSIKIIENPITVIPDGIFKNCFNMAKILFRQTNVTHITNHTFDGLTMIEKLALRSNPLRQIDAGAFADVCKSVVFMVIECSPDLLSLPKGLFTGCFSLQDLVLSANGFEHIAGETFTGLRSLTILSMRKNFHLHTISESILSGVRKILTMTLAGCNISEIPADLFHNVTLRIEINFGYNRLKTLPVGLFHKDNTIKNLLLQHNQISSIPDHLFHNLTYLRVIFLFGNKLIHITSYMFLKTNVQRIYLFRNNISVVEGYPFTTGVNSTIKSINIRDNPISRISWETMSNLEPGATVVLNCESVILPKRINNLNIKCESTRSKVFITIPFKSETRHALNFAGFGCEKRKDHITGGEIKCTSCPSGTFGNLIDVGCQPCPEGGFYQDKVGAVSDEYGHISCRICNPGTFVPFAGGNSAKSCQVCPDGTDKTRHAGFRACFCLDNYYRKDRFGKCFICPQDGVNCSGDILQLRQGYYWHWTSSNNELYEKFKSNLKIFNDSYDRKTTSFNASLPMIYKCPIEENCVNNVSEVKGNCREGYHGWMCTVCKEGYIKLVGPCKDCFVPEMVFLDVVISLAPLIILLTGFLCSHKTRYNEERSHRDEIISRWKITLGFYQVASIYWLQIDSLSSSAPILQIFIFRLMKALGFSLIESFHVPSCFFGWFSWNSHSELKVTYMFYVVCFTLLMFTYIVTKLLETRLPILLRNQTYVKNYCVGACVVILFLTYSEICKVTFQLFYCDSFFIDENKVDAISLLHSDYSINCDSESHKFHILLSAPLLVFVICFPVVLLIALKKYIPPQPGNGNLARYSPWISFLCEGYKSECWYWEVLEIFRKAVLIAVPVLFGWSGVTKIMAVSFSTFLIIVYIEKKPMKDRRKAGFQLTSLFLVHLNIIIAAVRTTEHASYAFFILISVLNTGFALLIVGITIIEYFANRVSCCHPQRPEVTSGAVSIETVVFSSISTELEVAE